MDTLDPYFESEVLNIMETCPNMVTVLLKNQSMSESCVRNNIFYSNPQPGGKNESAINELLKAYVHKIDDQFNWPFHFSGPCKLPLLKVILVLDGMNMP
ncbi:hypothetical protein AKG98_1375 [Moritella sp. JT01]|uniref:hypothetical protein n=1 Tax=Moritella sp. JT01 TaxID=756698 RepID=UPI00079CBE36|nr:hypothetical protein [Moritella sp. JT01]KXO09163.1 hypothetical protein AKG98_1375 [Moritella sp. JT01]